jgi:hypothetical protein
MAYKTFTRTWWKLNKTWPNGLEPHAGRKTYCGHYQNETEAQAACQAYNSTHDEGKLSRKMEYEHS